LFSTAMAKWGSPTEIQIRLRMKLSAAAYAYEFEPEEKPLCSDEEFDEASKMIDLSILTSRPDLDAFFKEHFNPSTGVWIHKHPELDQVREYTKRLRSFIK